MSKIMAMFIATHYRQKHLHIVMNITGPLVKISLLQAHTTRSNCFSKGFLNLLTSRPHKEIHKFMRPLSLPISENFSSANCFTYLSDSTVAAET
jgi:hypothetical protein